MVIKELIEIYNFIHDLSNRLNNILDELDNNLKRKEVLFNRYHIYPIFAHKIDFENHKIYEPNLISVFYFDMNYYKNIGVDTCIYDENKIDISISTKVQTMYNLKINKFSNKLPKKKAIYNFVYDYFDIPRLKNKITNILSKTNDDNIFVFVITAGILQDIITSLILKYKDVECLCINQSVINLYKKLFKKIYFYLESYFDSDFWYVRNDYNLYLSFDIIITDYEDSYEKREPIYDIINYAIKYTTEYFTNKKIKKDFKNIKFAQAIKSHISTKSENINIIRNIFYVKNFADLIIEDIIHDYIEYI